MRYKDEIFLRPSDSSSDHQTIRGGKAKKTKLLLFFVTGNPGLIGYYRTFLTHLWDLIRDRNSKQVDHYIYGTSLLGFERGDVWLDPNGPTPPFSLREQIDGVVRRLVGTVKRVSAQDEDDSEPVQVVLMGHSVGAYILLEVIARWQERRMHLDRGRQSGIVGGVCLFPTVVDIAKSPTGKKAVPLLRIPYLPLLVHLFAKALTAFMPMSILVRLIQSVMDMPEDGAHTTATFIKSKYGVQQALYMAKDEMNEMTHDRWSDELWGLPKVQDLGVDAAGNSTSDDVGPDKLITPKLYFYWAREDHWIADSTRDAIIATRARQVQSDGGAEDDSSSSSSRPLMEIATDDVPHAFCLRHSKSVAEKCAEYVQDLEDRLGHLE